MRVLALLLTGVVALWQDCSEDEGIASPLFTFANVTSDPEPLLYGQTQRIYKTMTNHGPTIDNVSATLSQYWQVGGHWLRFLKIKVNQCADHGNLCPFKSGSSVEVVTVHPKLAWLTPFGWYRSRQVYTGPDGKSVGCVDMQFRYCKDEKNCYPPQPHALDKSLVV